MATISMAIIATKSMSSMRAQLRLHWILQCASIRIHVVAETLTFENWENSVTRFESTQVGIGLHSNQSHNGQSWARLILPGASHQWAVKRKSYKGTRDAGGCILLVSPVSQRPQRPLPSLNHTTVLD